jgi:hypothetical protein
MATKAQKKLMKQFNRMAKESLLALRDEHWRYFDSVNLFRANETKSEIYTNGQWKNMKNMFVLTDDFPLSVKYFIDHNWKEISQEEAKAKINVQK